MGVTWVNLFDLYGFDDFFSTFKLSPLIDRNILINTITDYIDDTSPVYRDKDFCIKKINSFFDRNYDTFDRLAEIYKVKYNPIENYNKTELRDLVVNTTTKDTSNDTTNNVTTMNTDSDSNDFISAFDSSTLSPKGETTTIENINTNNDIVNNSSRDSINNSAHKETNKISGNIGVTTTQQMLQSELDIRMKLNIYEIIARKFYKEFCLYC